MPTFVAKFNNVTNSVNITANKTINDREEIDKKTNNKNEIGNSSSINPIKYPFILILNNVENS